MLLQAIRYKRGELAILDQLKLPHQEVYINIGGPEDARNAIRSMQVRGAPAIAIVAALSLTVWGDHYKQTRRGDRILEQALGRDTSIPSWFSHNLKYLVTSRPTAVNLADAARKLEKVVWAAFEVPGATRSTVIEAYIEAAEQMLVDDVQDNEKIGEHGTNWILKNTSAEEPVSVLTHCNTGSLATAGHGTALGVVRTLHARNSLRRCFYTETRPYNQGSRLTGYELIHENIPATLITDSMAAALLRQKGESENIVAVVVGADRVAANGDTANKIGTYALAVLARFHDIKFLVAAPRTTVDLGTDTGADIKIEERPSIEMTRMKGPPFDRSLKSKELLAAHCTEEISIAAKGTHAWNPAFDVTPAALIDGIVTENGVVEKDQDGRFRWNTVFDPETISLSKKRKRAPSLADPSSDIPEGRISWKEALEVEPDRVPSCIDWNMMESGDELAKLPKRPVQQVPSVLDKIISEVDANLLGSLDVGEERD